MNDTKDISNQDSWESCLEASSSSSWLREPLHRTLHYTHPLPIQRLIVPLISRALLSGVPMDVSLTAPTGSGKTLCYLLPMLQLISEEKRRNTDNTQLRGIILVPTRALGQQVFRVISRLTRHTTIRVATLCGGTDENQSGGMEGEMLARCVRKGGDYYDNGDGVSCCLVEGKTLANALVASSSEKGEGVGTGGHSSEWVCDYFSLVDILVSTPQRLLYHLDETSGLSLASLRLLVVDEADQVLEGSFANLVVKVVERFEEEVHLRAVREEEGNKRSRFVLSGDPSKGGDAFLNYLSFSAQPVLRKTDFAPTLHKVLCSATLSPRIARISQVHLRNCQYFTLNTHGEDMNKGGALASSENSELQLPLPSSVSTFFALPPALQEHIVFVEEFYRHAVFLKLISTLLERLERRQRRRSAGQEKSANFNENDASDGEKGGMDQKKEEEDASSYPCVEDRSGSGILVFCSSPEEARVMGHFLTLAGVRGVLEFTTLATEAERRRALLNPSSSSSPLSSSSSPFCVVASDALMRGVDMPNVGHVIMYHPPETLSQYVHRAGRTARAMRPGHLHLLLNKIGESGTLEDGEVARFRTLSAGCLHALPARYERGFFLFARAPLSSTRGGGAVEGPRAEKRPRREGDNERVEKVDHEEDNAERTAIAEGRVGAEKEEMVEMEELGQKQGSAEWWVEQANHFLQLSQQQLQQRWSSALDFVEKAQKVAAMKEKENTASTSIITSSGENKTLPMRTLKEEVNKEELHSTKREGHRPRLHSYGKGGGESKGRPFPQYARRQRGK